MKTILILALLFAGIGTASASDRITGIQTTCGYFGMMAEYAMAMKNEGIPVSTALKVASDESIKANDPADIRNGALYYIIIAYRAEKGTPPDIIKEVVYERCVEVSLQTPTTEISQ